MTQEYVWTNEMYQAVVDRAAQLEGERDAARQELRELQSHHTSIVLALYKIDEEVFGPLTVKEGIAELKKQRDEARADIVRYQDERVTLLVRIEELIARVKELEDKEIVPTVVGYISRKDWNEHCRRLADDVYQGETPLGIEFDCMGDEAEP